MTSFLSKNSFASPAYIHESAWLTHIPFAFTLVEKLQPKILVELGVHTGSSYFAFCQAVKSAAYNTICYGIDSWKGDEHAGYYDEDVFKEVQQYNKENYAGFSYLIRSNFEQALPSFEDGIIDLLHIDGYHKLESVSNDFFNWLPKMSKKGIVLLHDINVREKEFGVHLLWQELKTKYPAYEFKHGYGLGILAVGSEVPKELAFLFSKINKSKEIFINTAFGHLGSYVQHQFEFKKIINHISTLEESVKKQNHLISDQQDLLEKRDIHIKHLEQLNNNLYKQLSGLNEFCVKELTAVVQNFNQSITNNSILNRIEMMQKEQNNILQKLIKQGNQNKKILDEVCVLLKK